MELFIQHVDQKISSGSRKLLRVRIKDGWGTLKSFEKQTKSDVKKTEFRKWIFQNVFLHDSLNGDLLVFVSTSYPIFDPSFGSSFQLYCDFQHENGYFYSFFLNLGQRVENALSWIAWLEIFQNTLHDQQEIQGLIIKINHSLRYQLRIRNCYVFCIGIWRRKTWNCTFKGFRKYFRDSFGSNPSSADGLSSICPSVRYLRP